VVHVVILNLARIDCGRVNRRVMQVCLAGPCQPKGHAGSRSSMSGGNWPRSSMSRSSMSGGNWPRSSMSRNQKEKEVLIAKLQEKVSAQDNYQSGRKGIPSELIKEKMEEFARLNEVRIGIHEGILGSGFMKAYLRSIEF
jgi:hypothetical protein